MKSPKVINRVFRWLAGIRNDFFISVDQVKQAGAKGKSDGLESNVVMAPIQFVQRSFTQAQPVVQAKKQGKWNTVDDHALEQLLLEPNAFYDGDAMHKAMLFSWFWDGNVYLLKGRGEFRRVSQLWYTPHWLIEPAWPTDGSQFISHYEYRPDSGREPIRLHPSDVIHLRFGLDPRNPRKGLSQLKAAIREVLTDEEAAKFSEYLLSNMGVPGGVVSPVDKDALPSEEDVEAMKQYMKGFEGERRGGWMVVGAPTKIEQFGFDPNRLMLGPLRDVSEERVCAMIGVPAAVVGFGSGLQQTKVGATMRELVRLARVNCIEPTQTTIARQLSRQLLPEFEVNPRRFRVTYDNSSVSMFQEDETERAKRAVMLYAGRIIKRSAAQAMVGAEVDTTDDGYAEAEKPQEGGNNQPPKNRVAAVLNGNQEN